MTRRFAACLAVAVVATPCLWDADTLDTELRGLPGAFDLVVGRWHRHGDAYYEDRVRRLLAQPALSLAQHDDLAVAYEHLGERERAIEVMAQKAAALAATPDGEQQYRYHANLGTFLAHAGRHDEALVELRRAVAIDPAAHFGREHFQIELIEYVVAARREPALWRQGSFLLHAGYALSHLTDWVREGAARTEQPTRRPLEFEDGFDAIGGMLRFGGREGPELYRSLAELFLDAGHLNLAWWSLHRAIERGHPAADVLAAGATSVERHWRASLGFHPDSRFSIPTEALYREHREAADRWLAAFQRLEAEAIARGEDVGSDAALQALLAAADAEVPRPALPWSFSRKEWVFGTMTLVVLLLVYERFRRNRASRAA